METPSIVVRGSQVKRHSPRIQALVVGALAVLATGSQPAPAARKSTAPPILEGTVEGPGGRPVPKALVTARDLSARFEDPPLSARTDAEGRFRLSPKGGGLHMLQVEAQGLVSKRAGKVRPGTTPRPAPRWTWDGSGWRRAVWCAGP